MCKRGKKFLSDHTDRGKEREEKEEDDINPGYNKDGR